MSRARKKPRSGTIKKSQSILCGACVEVLLDHKSYLEHDSVLEFAQVKTGELLDLFKSVHQSVAVYEQLTRGLGNVEVVFEEALDGEQGLLIEALDGTALEYFLQEADI